MTTPITAHDQTSSLYRIIVSTGIVLSAFLALLALLGPPQGTLAQLPSFVMMAHGFLLLASLCIAYLCLGRYWALQDAASYWIGYAFLTYSAWTIFYILCWPGMLADGGAIVASTPNLASWVYEVSQAVLAALLIVSACRGDRQSGPMSTRLFGLHVALGLGLVLGGSLLLLALGPRLPLMVAGTTFTALSHASTWSVAAMMAVGSVLSARAYRRSGNGTLAYSSLMMMAFTVANAVQMIGVARYSLLWYSSRFFMIGGSLTLLSGLLNGYVALYRREQESRQEAQRHLEELNAIVNTLPDTVVIYDMAGNVVHHNAAANALVKRTTAARDAREIEATHSFRRPDGTPLPSDKLPGRRALRGETVQSFHMIASDMEGNDLHVLSSASPLYVRGEQTGAIICWRDVGELQRTREEAQRQAAQLDAVIGSIADGVIVYDAQGRILRSNAVMDDLLQYSDELRQSPLADRTGCLGPRDAARQLIPLSDLPAARALQGETVTGFLMTFYSGTDHEITSLCSAAPLHGPEGKVAGAVLTITDVTAMRRMQEEAEQLAAEAQRRATELDATINTIADGVAIYDADGNIVRANMALRAQVRFTDEEASLPLSARLKISDPRDAEGRPIPEDQYTVRRALRGETVTSSQITLYPGTERETTGLHSAAPLRGAHGEVIGAVVTVTDITETGRLQKALRASEARLRAVFGALVEGIVFLNQQGEVEMVNEAVGRLHGHTLNELTAPQLGPRGRIIRPDGTLFPVDDQPAIAALRTGEAVRDVEMGVPLSDGTVRWRLVNAQPVRDDQGNLLGAVASSIDITERKQAQEATAAERATLRAVMDTAPYGIVLTDAQGRLTYTNPAAQALYARPVAYGQPVEDHAAIQLCHLDGTPWAAHERPLERSALHGEEHRNVHMLIVWPDGQSRHLLVQTAPVRNQSGDITAAVGIFGDITELRQVQEAAQQRATELDAVIDSMADGVVIYNTDGSVRRTNEAAMVAGHLKETPAERSLPERVRDMIILDEDGEPVPLDALPPLRALRGETVHFQITHVEQPDGSRRWFATSAAPLHNQAGEITGAVATLRDISDMRQAEAELRKSEERLNRAQELAHLGSWELDASTQALSWSDEIFRILGLEPQEFVPTYERFMAAIHPDDRDTVDQSFRASIAEGRLTHEIQYRIVRARTGEIRFAQADRRHLRDAEGRLIRTYGTLHDITERKQAEEKLRQQAALLDTAPVLARDPQDRIILWSHGLQKLYGYSAEQALGQNVHEFLQTRHPLPQPEIRQQIEASGTWQGELVHRCADGTTRTVMSNQVAYRAADGSLAVILETNADVTNLRETQEELRRHRDQLEDIITQRTAELVKSEREYRELVENANSAIIRWNRDGLIEFANEYTERILGYEPDELVGKPITIVSPETLADGRTSQFLLDTIPTTPEALERSENENITKDGRLLWMVWANRVIRDEQGRVVGVMSVGTDRTAQHEAEKELQANQERLRIAAEEVAHGERRYRELVETARSAIIQWDADGTITLINAYAEALFGYEHGELVGKDVMILAPKVEADTGSSLEGLKDAILADPEAFQTSENENVTKDGRRLWMVWTNRVVLDEHNEFEGVMAIGIDRTAQHQVEKELEEYRQRLRALAAELVIAEQRERQRLATVIHDGVAQTAGGLKMQLQLLRVQPEAAPIADSLGPLIGLAQQALTEARGAMSDLAPPTLMQLGLIHTLEWWGQDLFERYGLKVTVEAQCSLEQLEYDLQAALFQAVRELLQNTIRHAQADLATITVRGDESHVEIEVADDGVGFDPAVKRPSGSGGYGLFGAAERMSHLGGSLTVDAAPGKGTRVTISLPAPGTAPTRTD